MSENLTLPGISAIVIANNEADVIGACVASLRTLTDDIVVVINDTCDTATEEAALKEGATVHRHPWAGYGPQRNYAASLAKHDWIVAFDADETLSDECRKGILTFIASPSAPASELSYINWFLGKWLRHGAWYPDYKLRLYNKTLTQWNSDPVHEDLVLPVGTAKVRIKGDNPHYSVRTYDQYLTKRQKYTRLHAERLFQQGKDAGFTKIVLSPLFSFIKNYFFRLGFLDGFHGYMVARESAHYVFMKYSRLRVLNYLRKKNS